MLGDSMRRRRRPDRGRDESDRDPQLAVVWGAVAERGRRVGRWLGIAAAVATTAFGVGYGVAVLVVFPLPDEGAAGVPVPSVVGEVVEDAEEELRAAGLVAARTLSLSGSDRAIGVVVAQSPLPGQQLPRGATVELAVSARSVNVRVPDVVGFGVDRAMDLLARLGFGVARAERVSNEPAGRVLDVRPAPGTQTTLPANVRLTVSTGPPEPVVPDSLETMFDTARFPVRPVPMPSPADTMAGPGRRPGGAQP